MFSSTGFSLHIRLFRCHHTANVALSVEVILDISFGKLKAELEVCSVEPKGLSKPQLQKAPIKAIMPEAATVSTLEEADKLLMEELQLEFLTVLSNLLFFFKLMPEAEAKDRKDA